MAAQAVRADLEYRAAAAMELRRRGLARNTVYGIVDSTEGLLRKWTEIEGEWIETDAVPTIQIPAKLEPLLIKKKRIKVAFGGRGAGKSQSFGDIFAARAKDHGEKTGCFRELQNSIEDSVHALLKHEIERIGFDGFDVTQNAIRFNGEDAFKFKGLARNPDAVKSMHGFKFSWVEEAQVLSDHSLRMLTPTFREPGSELWFSLNPGSSEDPISERFLNPFMDELLKTGYYEDDLHLVVLINYMDNPWFPQELEQERAWDEENLSTAQYEHTWLGGFADHIDNALIAPEWFDACVDAHLHLGFDPLGARFAAHDPSDRGPDSKGYAARHGSVVFSVEEMTTGSANEGCDWATGKAINDGVHKFTWDCDGMGVVLSRQVDDAFKSIPTEVTMFRGSESVDFPDDLYSPSVKQNILDQKTNRNAFRNKRAQYYAVLRDRIYRTYRAVVYREYHDPEEMISFSSSIQAIKKLRAELSRMPTKPNPNGLFELYTKQEMLNKFKIKSPNLADSVMMLCRNIDSDDPDGYEPEEEGVY